MKTSNYGTARSVLGFVEFVMWCGIGGGFLLAVLAGSAASNAFGGGSSMVAAMPGLLIAVASFLGVVLVQMGKASVDTADYTFQMLGVARQQLEVSKKGIAAQEQAASYQQRAETAEAPNGAAFRRSRAASDSSPAALFSTPSIAEGTDDPPSDETRWEHRGYFINRSDRGFLVDQINFETLDAARAYVDEQIANERKKTISGSLI